MENHRGKIYGEGREPLTPAVEAAGVGYMLGVNIWLGPQVVALSIPRYFPILSFPTGLGSAVSPKLSST